MFMPIGWPSIAQLNHLDHLFSLHFNDYSVSILSRSCSLPSHFEKMSFGFPGPCNLHSDIGFEGKPNNEWVLLILPWKCVTSNSLEMVHNLYSTYLHLEGAIVLACHVSMYLHLSMSSRPYGWNMMFLAFCIVGLWRKYSDKALVPFDVTEWSTIVLSFIK